MATPDLITQTALREYLAYDAETGQFRWRKPIRRIRAGDLAGSLNSDGHVRITFQRREYSAHRLALFMTTGEWPSSLEIDHINGCRTDNRISNLREADRAMNGQNIRRPLITNTSGFLGVTSKGDKWQAQLTLGKRTIYLGFFQTPEAAHRAYVAAKRRLHKGCTI